MGGIYYVVMYELIEKTVRSREQEETSQASEEQ
jgi:hypothetical protein